MHHHERTEQENFWAGEFGDHYIQRNAWNADANAKQAGLWAQVLRRCPVPPASVLELGANIGINLRALSMLLPQAELSGLEINPHAAAILRNALTSCNNSVTSGGGGN